MLKTADMMIIETIMNDKVAARIADCARRGIIPMPDGWSWLNEWEVREDFAKASSGIDRGEKIFRSFRSAMDGCEQQGIVDRSRGPGSTSIRLT